MSGVSDVSGSLRTRIVTGVVLAVVLLAVVLGLPPVAETVAVLTALVVAGAWEWSGSVPAAEVREPACGYYVALVVLLLALAWQASAAPDTRELILAGAVVWWLTAFLWVAFAPRWVSPWSAGLCRRAGAGAVRGSRGWCAPAPEPPAWRAEWVLFALLLVWVADIGAFFVGRRFGRIRLAPEVSPGKTWEGALGGLAVSALVLAVAGGGLVSGGVAAVPAVVSRGGRLLDRRGSHREPAQALRRHEGQR